MGNFTKIIVARAQNILTSIAVVHFYPLAENTRLVLSSFSVLNFELYQDILETLIDFLKSSFFLKNVSDTYTKFTLRFSAKVVKLSSDFSS